MHVSHPLIKEGLLESRQYQEAILAKAADRNLMVVLPTGLGKTPIAMMLAVLRLGKFPEGRVMVLAPTRPLVNQHYKAFLNFLNIPQEEMQVITGTVNPKKRKDIYETKRIIFATPQTIRNDIKNDIFSFENYSLLVIDEIHHGVGEYAYPYLAGVYMKQSKNPRILGLTASPSSENQKIKEICQSCHIEEIEIKTETDVDVAPYVKEKKVEWVEVELPQTFVQIRDILNNALAERVERLQRLGFIRRTKATKKVLLDLQSKIFGKIKSGNRSLFSYLSYATEAIKIEHALTLIETQGIRSLENYFRKLRTEKSGMKLLEDRKMSNAMFLSNKLAESGASHPKMAKLLEVVNRHLMEDKEAMIIVFASYREMVKEIVSALQKLDLAKPIEFVGQRGLSQKEQIRIIQDFREGKYNILVGTSISEEGLDIPSMDIAIFYEPVPSEIRSIQRRGRVGRHSEGKIIILMTKNTRDEAYYWVAKNKEKKMKGLLYGMQQGVKQFGLASQNSEFPGKVDNEEK